jgi:hypothetical protein
MFLCIIVSAASLSSGSMCATASGTTTTSKGVENALLGDLTGEDQLAGLEPTEQIVQRAGVERAMAHLEQVQATFLRRDGRDEVWPPAVQRRVENVAEIGSEIAVVVVDVNQVDVVAVTGPCGQCSQRVDDVCHVWHQQFGILVLIRVQHVYDQHSDLTHG